MTTRSKLVRFDVVSAALNVPQDEIMDALLCLIKDASLMSIQDSNGGHYIWITELGRSRLLGTNFVFSEECFKPEEVERHANVPS